MDLNMVCKILRSLLLDIYDCKNIRELEKFYFEYIDILNTYVRLNMNVHRDFTNDILGAILFMKDARRYSAETRRLFIRVAFILSRMTSGKGIRW